MLKLLLELITSLVDAPGTLDAHGGLVAAHLVLLLVVRAARLVRPEGALQLQRSEALLDRELLGFDAFDFAAS